MLIKSIINILCLYSLLGVVFISLYELFLNNSYMFYVILTLILVIGITLDNSLKL